MAKKTKNIEVEEPQVQMVEETYVEEPKVRERLKPSNEWEVKDRLYKLKGRKKPLSRSIRAAGIFYFDEEKGYERELKYCQNQKTSFVDEMKGDQRLEHIIFRNGTLFVERSKTTLQKLLSLYHPHKDSIFYEYKAEESAVQEVETLELQADAILAARDMSIEMAEAVMRVELGSKVSKMSSSELKRDLLIFAQQNPSLLLELVNDDNVQLRNFGIKAVEFKIIKLSKDQRNFLWGSNDRVVMTVPFDEHPYTALAHWFKTDEGMDIYQQIEKRLN